MTRLSWFKLALSLHGSVLPFIWPRILFFGLFSLLIASLQAWEGFGLDFSRFASLTNNVACNLVLGLLLVFRTNTAYDRFWEGRKAWGSLVVNIRNLAREVHTSIEIADHPKTQAERERLMRLLGAFAIATKRSLRRQSGLEAFGELLPESERDAIESAENVPLFLSCCLSQSLQRLGPQLGELRLIELSKRINELISGFTTCERILTTPVPISYNIFLKRLILVYCLLLPLSLVDDLGWWTPVAITLVSFVLLGVDRIGNEIEDPFGDEPNDLPLDAICQNLQDAIAQVSQFQGLKPVDPQPEDVRCDLASDLTHEVLP